MFKQPPAFFIKKQLDRYTELHQKSVPKWVFMMDREEMIRYLGLCNRLRWKLSDEVLTVGGGIKVEEAFGIISEPIGIFQSVNPKNLNTKVKKRKS